MDDIFDTKHQVLVTGPDHLGILVAIHVPDDVAQRLPTDALDAAERCFKSGGPMTAIGILHGAFSEETTGEPCCGLAAETTEKARRLAVSH